MAVGALSPISPELRPRIFMVLITNLIVRSVLILRWSTVGYGREHGHRFRADLVCGG